MPIDVRRLRVLRELASRGTVTATAEALSYSGPAVSQQLAALEREVGVALLERDGRRLRLTDAGTVLVRHADTLFGQLEAAEAELAAMGSEVVGSLRVASFQSGSCGVLAPALGRLVAAHPALDVWLEDAEPEPGLALLRSRELDLVLGHEYPFSPRPRDGAFERFDLFPDALWLALPAAHPAVAAGAPLPLTALAADRWIAGAPGTACGEIVTHACRAAGFEPVVRHTSNDFEVVLALVRAGLGVALVPDLALPTGPSRPGVHLVRPSRPLARMVYAAVRTGAAARPAVRALLTELSA